jgi:hypothetical protein
LPAVTAGPRRYSSARDGRAPVTPGAVTQLGPGAAHASSARVSGDQPGRRSAGTLPARPGRRLRRRPRPMRRAGSSRQQSLILGHPPDSAGCAVNLCRPTTAPARLPLFRLRCVLTWRVLSPRRPRSCSRN